MYLVGRNNAGKSNVLKSIRAFFDNKITSEDLPKQNPELDCELKVTFEDLSPNLRNLLSLQDEVKKIEVLKVFPGTKTPKISINGEDITKYNKNKESIREFKDKFHKYLPLYYYIPALRNLKDEETWKANSLIKS